MKICVFGASSNDIEKIYFEKTYELGKKMAERGHTLVFGGGARGLMGAVARGISSANGESIGISPSFFDVGDILYKEGTELIFTKTMAERKKLMEDTSDAFISVPGGVGTFEEFFEVLTLKQLQQHNKPLVLFNIKNYYDKFEELLVHTVKSGFMKEECKNVYRIFDSSDELLDYIENYDETLEKVLKY